MKYKTRNYNKAKRGVGSFFTRVTYHILVRKGLMQKQFYDIYYSNVISVTIGIEYELSLVGTRPSGFESYWQEG
jgi:hypothetical protein